MSELKPCPFCGGEAKVVEYWLKGIANKKHYWIECKACGVRKDNRRQGYRTRKNAVDAWNKREEMGKVEYIKKAAVTAAAAGCDTYREFRQELALIEPEDVVEVSKVRQVLLEEFSEEETEAVDALMEKML